MMCKRKLLSIFFSTGLYEIEMIFLKMPLISFFPDSYVYSLAIMSITYHYDGAHVKEIVVLFLYAVMCCILKITVSFNTQGLFYNITENTWK